jgi:hypothetical protein
MPGAFGDHEYSLNGDTTPLFVISDMFTRIRENPHRNVLLFGRYEQVFDQTAHFIVYAHEDFTRGVLAAAARYMETKDSRFVFPVFHATSAFDATSDLEPLLRAYPFMDQAASRIDGDSAQDYPATNRHIVWRLHKRHIPSPLLQKIYRLDVEEIKHREPREIVAMRDDIENLLSGTSK